jgi:hypothetical protein
VLSTFPGTGVTTAKSLPERSLFSSGQRQNKHKRDCAKCQGEKKYSEIREREVSGQEGGTPLEKMTRKGF